MTKIQNSKRFEHLVFDIVSNFDSPRGEAGIRISNLLFYLLILFLPTQLGRHFWSNFSFVSGIRVDYLEPTLYLTDILVLILFVVWILGVCHRESRPVGTWRSQSRRDCFVATLLAMTSNLKYLKFVVFVVFLIFGIFMSKNQAAGWYGFLKLLEFIFLGFYAAANIKRLRFGIVLLLFSIGIIFESFLAILQYLNQTSMGGIFYFLGERTFNSQTPGIANASINGNLVLRPYGTFSHPNVLAGYLAIGTILIFSGIKNYESRIKKIVFILTLTIGTIVLFLTFSRIAILIWLITLGIFLFRKFLNHKSYILILLGTLLILGLATPLGARFTELKLTDESITQRGELIRSSFSMIRSHPIFGVGLNNFLVELPIFHKQDSNVFYLQPVHNIYLLILAQTGVVGLVFFLWFIFKTYQRIKNQESRIKNKKPIIHNSLFMILSTALILGLFDHYFLTLQQGQLLFSFILGLCWSNSSKRNS